MSDDARVSGFLLFKNNKDTIEKALLSLKYACDEIIAVDTGAEDGSLDIVQNYTGKIHKFNFNNDFSEARNSALSKCSFENVFYMDSDEYILKEHADVIKNYALSSFYQGYYFKRKNYCLDTGKFLFKDFVLRFFKKSFSRFEFKVHETPEFSILKKGGRLSSAELPVIYHKYPVNSQKNAKYIKLLNQELAESENEYLTFHLFWEYYRLNDRKKIIETAKKIIYNNFQCADEVKAVLKEMNITL